MLLAEPLNDYAFVPAKGVNGELLVLIFQPINLSYMRWGVCLSKIQPIVCEVLYWALSTGSSA